MKKYATTESIPNLWYFCMYLKELDGHKMSVGDIRKIEKGTSPISERILDTWHKAHSYKEQLRYAKDQLRRRNIQIENLRKKLKNNDDYQINGID